MKRKHKSNFSWFTCVGKTCCPQYRCENEIIGAWFGRIGDSVWKTTLSQSIKTAPCWDFGPNGSTLHRHGYRNAALSSGHGCHDNELPDEMVTHSQNRNKNRDLHLCSIILKHEREKKHQINSRKTHVRVENWVQNMSCVIFFWAKMCKVQRSQYLIKSIKKIKKK